MDCRVSTQHPPDRLLTPQEVADYLGIPLTTLFRWRWDGGKGPRGHRVGRHLRYRSEDVEAWLAEQADEPRTPDLAAEGG